MEFPALVPVLTDGIVTLRAHDPMDVDDMIAQGRDPQTRRWTNVPSPYHRPDAEEFVRSCLRGWVDGDPLSWAIEVEARFAGTVRIRIHDHREASVGYGLAPWARGRGLTVRALRLVLPWAFHTLDLPAIRWTAIVGNWGSRRVAWRTGFQFEGRLRAMLCAHGERVDAWTGSLGADDPLKPGSPWYIPPTLDDGRIRLRAHAAQDRLRMTETARDAVTQAWLPNLPVGYTMRDAQEHLEEIAESQARGQGVFWAVTAVDDDTMVGEISLYIAHQAGSAEIGYWTHPASRSEGVAGRAVRLVADYALRPAGSGGLGLRRLVIRAAERNTASIRVALRAGFRLVGTDRAAEVLRDGTVTGLRRFDLIAGDRRADR
jgi:RimJ/RimL family protein N-acetyltransferase